MSDARLLSALSLVLAAPAIGLPLFLGFAGSVATALAVTAAIILMTWSGRSSIGGADEIKYDVLLFCLAASLALCLLGGEGGYFFANSDWLIRDALLHDMVAQPWPFAYRIDDADLGAQSLMMRAPLAMYMAPAAIGKVFGQHAAQLALLAQNAALLTLILYLIVPTHCRFWRAAAIVTVFVMFSGLDVVPVLARRALHIAHQASSVTPPDHLEPWADLFQYSSHITQVFWAAPHAIAGWAFAGLYLRWQRGNIRTGVLLSSLPFVAFWSPFALVGAAPFAGYAAASDLAGGKIGRSDVITVLLAALPAPLLLIFLAGGSGAVEHGFIIDKPNFWSVYVSFIYVEFVPYVVLLAVMRPAIVKDPTFLLIVGCLLFIPFYKVGVSNDFAMRASIPALALLAANFAIALAESLELGNCPAWTRLATAIVLIGAVTGAMEVRRALITPAAPVSDCDLLQAWDQSPFADDTRSNYLVSPNAMPRWLRPLDPAPVPAAAATRCSAQ